MWASPGRLCRQQIYPLDLTEDLSVGSIRWIFPGHVRWICPLDLSADLRQPAERLSHTLSPRFEEAAWTEAVPPSRRGAVVGPTHPHLPLPARRQAGPTSPSLAYPLPPCATGERDGGGRQLRAP